MGIEVVFWFGKIYFFTIIREFVAELIGTIIFVFIAKATGFALATGGQEVRKRGIFGDFFELLTFTNEWGLENS